MPANPWTSLLAGCSTASGLASLASAIGFGRASPLDDRAAASIGLPDGLQSACVAGGPGTARMLLLMAASALPVREQVRSIAARLTMRAPHLMWLLALANPRRGELAVAAWQAGRGRPRVAALVVNTDHVLRSDEDTVAALADAMDAGDLVVHARWMEVLGREAISRRFFSTLERLVNRLADGAVGRATATERRELALLNVSRMLFLSFLESRRWLDGDRRFLSRTYDECMTRGGGYQRRVLTPLFFGTLNTPVAQRAARARSLGSIPFLNGGLFTRTPVETRRRDVTQSDDDWGAVHDDLLLRYRFTGREESGDWREAAVDPEMLGRAFESLMAAGERRATGAYFTPVSLVERTADTAIEALLVTRGVSEGTLARVVEGVPLEPSLAARLARAVDSVRLLDPACGSGAFLVHALERFTQLRRAAGDQRQPPAVRRDVIARSIFGVDINPTAVWLCELRLWLALVIDHADDAPGPLPPLPNLDHNIRCGDALNGGDFSVPTRQGTCGESGRLRARYVRATGTRKRSLGRALDRLERTSLLMWYDARLDAAVARRRDLVLAARGRDLFGRRRGSVGAEAAALREVRTLVRDLRAQKQRVAGGGALPFAFAAHFPDTAADGGFDLVVGNPPWVRVHHIPRPERERWRREFLVYREAAWADGAGAARAGAGFGAQVDVASLFIERGVALLRPGGVLSFLVPSKLWRSLAGGGVRRFVGSSGRLVALEDWSDAPPAFEAATYPSLLALMRPGPGPDTGPPDCRLGVHHGRVQVLWRAPREHLPLDESPGAPWVALPPDARSEFDRLSRSGVPLAGARLGTITMGVKSGCNAAYLVRDLGGVGDDRHVTDGHRTARLPERCLRPVLRGDAVRPWQPAPSDERIIFPHDAQGRVLPSLPPTVRSWLVPWRSRLASRSDARAARAWWSLFRLDGARCDHPRVAWADIGRSLQALVLPAGEATVPLNTCYVVATRDMTDALALAALLNSAVVNAWLGAVCEPARGGYRRHFAWSLARLPVPDDWARARALLAPLGERGMAGASVGRTELLERTLEAYRLGHASVAALLAWTAR